MTEVVDDNGQIRKVVDNDLSGGVNSPKQQTVVDTGTKAQATTAMVLGALAFGGVIICAILLPQLNAAQIRAEVAEQTKPIAVAAASAQDRAWLAERTGNINAEHLNEMRFALEAKGFHIELNDHK